MDEQRTSFVMYNTYYRTYQRLYKRNPEKAHAFITAIMEYALFGISPDPDDPILDYVDTIFAQLDASASRYEKSKKGGRASCKVSKEQILEAMNEYSTWKEIAEKFNIDEKTLRRLRDEYEIEDPKPRGKKTGKMGKTSESYFPDSYSEKSQILGSEYKNGKNGKDGIPGNFPGGKWEKPEKLNVDVDVDVDDNVDFDDYDDSFLGAGEEDQEKDTEEKKETISHFPRLTKEEALDFISTTERPLYMEGNYILDEDSDDMWEIIENT